MSLNRLALLSPAVAVALCTACSGTSSPFSPITSSQSLSETPRSPISASRVNGQRSWMDPDARKHALLYVSGNQSSPAVYVYSYPVGKLVGRLTTFTSPAGDCADATGHVWITDGGAAQIVEYAHGGKTPIATLSDAGQIPNGCAVDPRSGDLSVTNYASTTFGPGSVSIYRMAAGVPKMYADANFHFMLFPGYDNRSNLFVDGDNISGVFRYAELPRGKKTFTDINLGTISSGGAVQWDGTYMTVADEGGAFGPAVIYQTKGSTIVGSTTLAGTSVVFQSFIDGSKVIAPDNSNRAIKVYDCPAGGASTDTIGPPNVSLRGSCKPRTLAPTSRVVDVRRAALRARFYASSCQFRRAWMRGRSTSFGVAYSSRRAERWWCRVGLASRQVASWFCRADRWF